jgi:plasmid stabilization system protein ParE
MASKFGYSIIVSSRAQKELAESWNWYEDRLPGLGDRFVNEVLKCTRQIEENPDRFPTKFKAYKEAQVKTFPFLVIYRINKKANSVRVVSVFHTARNPRKKYK